MWQPSDEAVDVQCAQNEAYSVNFLQLSSAIPEDVVIRPLSESSVSGDLRPAAGLALKKGGTKRTTFTKEQKEIMIVFYERQKTSQIGANPADVIDAMRASGVPELKESQIKSWWGTYHCKQKQLAADMVEEARQIRSQQQGTGVNPYCSVDVFMQSITYSCKGHFFCQLLQFYTQKIFVDQYKD